MEGTPSLRDVPLFRHLNDEEREELEELLEPADFEAGETLFEEGGLEVRLYVITSGTVEVHKGVLPGRRQQLATMKAPTVVGEMGLLTEPRAAASVEAKTSVEAYGIDRDRFLEMRRRLPGRLQGRIRDRARPCGSHGAYRRGHSWDHSPARERPRGHELRCLPGQAHQGVVLLRT